MKNFPRLKWLPVVVLSFGASGVEGAEPTAPASAPAADAPAAYKKVCAYCHELGVGPALLGRSLPPELITVFVRNGNAAMPAFRASEISDDELAKVAEFISKH